MKKFIVFISLLLPAIAAAELAVSLDGGISGITSNSVIDIDHDSTSVWLGTGAGASVSTDDGQTWISYGPETFPSGEVSALAANNKAVWVAISHSEAAAGEAYPYGDGVAITRDGGVTWSIVQPSQIHFYGKIAYDLALYDTIAFASCFYGGLVRTADFGQTWQNLFATQLDSINSDSTDYFAENYTSLGNRYFSVKTDTASFPDTLSVWAGSAKGITRFFFSTNFSDDFSRGLVNWRVRSDSIPRISDSHGRTFVLSNRGGSDSNIGLVLSKKLIGSPGGFTLEDDIYLEVNDTIACCSEAGIALPKIANPVLSDIPLDTAFDAGLYFSLAFMGESCIDSEIPPEALHHAWYKARFLDENDSLVQFDTYSDTSADSRINAWQTLVIEVDSMRTVRFLIASANDTTIIWAPTNKLHPSMTGGRNVVLGFNSSGSAGTAYHDGVRTRQTGRRVYPTYPDYISKHYYSSSDTTVDDSLKLPGNHVVALGINQVDLVKYVWAACRPVSSGEARRVGYTIDNGQTWHEVNIVDPSGDDDVEAWDFAFARDTVYVSTSFGLYRSSGDYTNWTLFSDFRDSERQAFYQDNAPFYSVDVVENTLWAGGADGVVKSVVGGWDVFRSQRDASDHYAYPSPFSPTISTRHGTTIHFMPAEDTHATVKIFDFNMELVKTVVQNLPRLGGVESDDVIWDGTNDKGKTVANGVYFYQIQLDSGDDLWGKVVVIK